MVMAWHGASILASTSSIATWNISLGPFAVTKYCLYMLGRHPDNSHWLPRCMGVVVPDIRNQRGRISYFMVHRSSSNLKNTMYVLVNYYRLFFGAMDLIPRKLFKPYSTCYRAQSLQRKKYVSTAECNKLYPSNPNVPPSPSERYLTDNNLPPPYYNHCSHGALG